MIMAWDLEDLKTSSRDGGRKTMWPSGPPLETKLLTTKARGKTISGMQHTGRADCNPVRKAKRDLPAGDRSFAVVSSFRRFHSISL